MRRLLMAASLAFGLLATPPTSRADVDLWPLLVLSEESTVILYPFFVREGKFLMMFPVYYRTHEGRDHHVVWPIFKVSDGDLVRVAPVWFRGENSYTLFPILHRTPDSTLWSAPPSYFRQDGSFQGVFPFFARGEHDLFVMPTYYRRRHPDKSDIDSFLPFFDSRWDEAEQERSLFVLPGFYRYRKPDEPSVDLLFPFFYSSREETESALFVLPTYYRSRDLGGRNADTLFPFYHSRWDDDTEHQNVLFGLWGRSEGLGIRDRWAGYLARFKEGPGEERSSWVLPFYLSTRTADFSRLFVLPYYRSESPNTSFTSVFPVYWRRHDIKQRALHTVLFPLYYRASGPLLSRTWVFPLWLSSWDARQDGEVRSWFSVLWPIYERTEVRSPEGALIERSRRFAIFSDVRDAEGGRTFKVFGLPIYEKL